MIQLGHVTEIENYNVPKDCCCEECCDTKATKCVRITVDGFKIFVVFCDEHAAEYEERYYEQLKEKMRQ